MWSFPEIIIWEPLTWTWYGRVQGQLSGAHFNQHLLACIPGKAPGTTCKEMLHFFLFISSSPLLFLLLFPFPLLSFPLVFLLSPPPASILITKVTQITTPSLFHMNWNFFLHLNKDLVTFEIGFSLLLIPFKNVMCIFLKHLFTCNQRTENETFFPIKLAGIY